MGRNHKLVTFSEIWLLSNRKIFGVESSLDNTDAADLQMKYTIPNAAPRQPACCIFYVYCMPSHKNCCYPIPTTPRIKAIKLPVKTEVERSP